MTISHTTRRKIFEKRNMCECCKCHTATELHHCIVHRRKGLVGADTEENLMPICHDCHMRGTVNSHEFRVKFWKEQIKRGYDMTEWYDSLMLKYKENFDD